MATSELVTAVSKLDAAGSNPGAGTPIAGAGLVSEVPSKPGKRAWPPYACKAGQTSLCSAPRTTTRSEGPLRP
jgi:hypothetical protein